MNWGTLAQWAGVFVAFLALNAMIMQWLLTRREDRRARETSRVDDLTKQLYDLRATLPIDYVRREDWIRFGNTVDAKMDSMRDEIRDELRDLKLHCPACEVKLNHA